MRTFLLCRAGLAAACLLGSANAWPAQAPSLPDLPPTERVREVILALPEVSAANAARRADLATQDRLRTGPHEFSVRVGVQQRRARETDALGAALNHRYTEPQISLERALRMPGKAARDEAIGQAGVALGEVRRADAIHEASRSLLMLWFDALRERASTQLWAAQVATQTELLRRTEQRLKAGDAARTELLLQQAALAQLQASLAGATGREQAAVAALATQYPGLPSPPAPNETNAPLPTPPEVANFDAGLAQRQQQDLVEHSHEWRLARSQAELARQQAERSTLDQRADPTLSLFAASERAGADRLLGVALTMPLGGAARDAQARIALAQADEWAQRAEQAHRKVQAEAAQQLIKLDAAQRTWQRQAEALASAQASLQASLRGWQLGEYAAADVLLARRVHTEAALAELAARVDARHQQARLQLDLHALWEFDDD